MKKSPSQKSLTIKDIARIAKVSPATVSLVINDRPGVSPETRDRLLMIVQALNYQPNLVARSLVKRRSYAIAMLITNTRNPIFPEIASGVDDVVNEFGYSLSIISTYDDEKMEANRIEKIRARGIDGIITSAALIEDENIRNLVQSGYPVVSVLRRVYNCPELDYVNVDNVKGGYLAAEHLIRLGHKGGPVGEIRKKLDIPASTLSHHIAKLVHSGLITQERDSRSLYCKADLKNMDALMTFLVRNCCAEESCIQVAK